jgi:hypothetical protein
MHVPRATTEIGSRMAAGRAAQLDSNRLGGGEAVDRSEYPGVAYCMIGAKRVAHVYGTRALPVIEARETVGA